MRVLLSAYAFSPYRGSECAVGWNIVTRMAKFHEVTVLCGDVSQSLETKKDLERYFNEHGPIPQLTIQYVPPSILIIFIERLHQIPGLWALYYLAYNLWQLKAYRVAKELQAKRPFDLAHHLNMIGYREPGYLWRLPLTFVWGPVGGSPNESWAYRSLFSFPGQIKVLSRTWINEIQKRMAFRAKKAAKKAAKIWAVTTDDLYTVNNIWGAHAEQMIETGTTLRDESRIRTWDGKEPLKIVCSGIHTSRKALPIVFRAIVAAGIKDKLKIVILGAGPETESWVDMANHLRLAESITWRGMLSHQEAMTDMNDAHLLLFPSLKEGTPHVVLEALSLGVPVICHDACGMGIAVTDSCGIKISLRDPEASIKGFEKALKSFFNNPALVETLSKGALARAAQLTWEKKVEAIAKGYENVFEGNPAE
jgi:glycosyltransferase involved in cell wall biosynthesis